jgi:cytochrome c-type biogenesis protein CcmH
MNFRVHTATWTLLFSLCFNAFADQALEDRVRAIASGLRCVVCQNLSVADSPSEMAVQMRGIVREQLKAAKTPDEIRAYFVSKYGEWVLLAPTAQGFNLTVWVLPFAVLLAGLGLAVWFLRRWSRRGRDEPEEPVDPELLERVRAEVGGGDFGQGRLQELPDDDHARIYQDLRELEFDRQAGKLSEADYESLKQRYERQAVRRLAEIRENAAAPPPPEREMTRPTDTRKSRRGWALAVGATVLLAGGITLGLLLGQSLRPRTSTEDSITGDFLTGTGPGGISRPRPSEAPAAALRRGQEAFQRKDFKTAIEAFRAVLGEDPGHPLANAYMGMVLAQAGHADAALKALDRALSRTPNLPLALWAKGMILHQEGRDPDGAREHLQRLEKLLPAGEQRDAVREIIAQIGQKSEEPARALAGTGIEGTVLLDPGQATQGGGRSTLYIVARVAGAQGGPPLAVKRIVGPTFPVSFSLGPGDVMMPGMAFEGPLNLSARLDRDGDPLTREPGEPAGAYQGNPVKPGARNVAIQLR